MAYTRGQLPKLKTYEEALGHFNSVVPYKAYARHGGERPLGVRRRDEARIAMNGDAIECILYKTPVLTYKPDGSITLRTDGYISQMTASFIAYILNRNCFIQHNKMWLTDGDKTFPIHDGMVLVDGKPTHATKAITHYVDRKAFASVKKKYKVLTDYIVTLSKMMDGQRISCAADSNSFNTPRIAWKIQNISGRIGMAQQFLTKHNIDDPEVLKEAFDYVHNLCCTERIFKTASGWEHDIVINAARAENMLLEFMKYAHNDEIFYAKEEELTKPKRDVNLKYIFRTTGQAV